MALAAWVQASQAPVVGGHLFAVEDHLVWHLDLVVLDLVWVPAVQGVLDLVWVPVVQGVLDLVVHPDLAWGPAQGVLGQEDPELIWAPGLVVPDLAWVPAQGALALALAPVQGGPDPVSGVLPVVVPLDLALVEGPCLMAFLQVL